jgi:hypothetical protein
MAFTFNGAQANVTLSSQLGINIPSSDQTIVNEHFTGTGGLQTVYTVPAGKLFYLFGVRMSNGVNLGNIYKNDGTTIVYYGSTLAGQSNLNLSTSSPLAVYSATESVKANFTLNSKNGIWGILVDV